MFDSRPDWFGLDPGFVRLMGTWTTAAVCVTFSRPHFDACERDAHVDNSG